MSDVTYDLNGYLAAQVDAFARVIEQRDQARDIAARLEGECAHLEQERDALICERDTLLDERCPHGGCFYCEGGDR